jgi:hypothetical protein
MYNCITKTFMALKVVYYLVVQTLASIIEGIKHLEKLRHNKLFLLTLIVELDIFHQTGAEKIEKINK